MSEQAESLTEIFEDASLSSVELEQQRTRAPSVISLTRNDVRTYITAVVKLQKVGAALDEDKSLTKPNRTVGTRFATHDARSVMAEHDVTPEQLTDIGHSLAVAMAAVDVGPARLESAKAASADLLAQLQVAAPPSQYSEIRARVRANLNLLRMMSNQPEGNIELATRYYDDVRAAHGSVPAEESPKDEDAS